MIYRSSIRFGYEKVELQGVEPWSKQETNMLSTCVVDYWFSNQGWKSTSDLDLIPLFSPGNQDSFRTSPNSRVPRNRKAPDRLAE
jgi:hypothetical protein